LRSWRWHGGEEERGGEGGERRSTWQVSVMSLHLFLFHFFISVHILQLPFLRSNFPFLSSVVVYMTSFSGHCSVLLSSSSSPSSSKIGFQISSFLVNKPNIQGEGKDQQGNFFIQTPQGGCLPGVHQGKPAASHLRWIKHTKYADYLFEGPTALSDSILTQTGVWCNWKSPSVQANFIMRSVPVKSASQWEEEYAKPFDLYLCSAPSTHDFARGVAIDLERSGYRVFLEDPNAPVNAKREQAIVKNCKTFGIIMSDLLFHDSQSISEISAALFSSKPLLRILYPGSRWGKEEFPEEEVIPQEVKQAFQEKEVIKHGLNEFDELIGTLKERLGEGTGTPWK
jgi:hypothetical protein